MFLFSVVQTTSAAAGAQRWVGRYTGPDDDWARSLAVSPDGARVYVTGYSRSAGPYSYDYATVAYDAAAPCAPGRYEDGPVSAPIHDTVEPAAGAAGPTVHQVNCDIVVADGG